MAMYRIQTETKRDFSPFSGLEKSKQIFGKHSEFYDLPKYPNLIVRKSFVNISFADRAVEFQKTARRCSLWIPKTWYIIGYDVVSKVPSLFAVTERINGKNLSEIFLFDEKIQKELDMVCTSVCLHLWDAHREGGYVLSDFRKEQIIFGSVAEEKEKHLFLADMDPLVEFWKKGQRENYFWEYLYRVCTIMKQTEFDGNFHRKARREVKRILAKSLEPASKESKNYHSALLKLLSRSDLDSRN